MITKNISLLIISNAIAVFIYFFRLCYTYGCVTDKHITLPFRGLYMPVLMVFKDFRKGLHMFMSFRYAWIYIIIASSLSLLFILTEKKENKSP